MTALLAKPAVKYVALGLAFLALLGVAAWYIRSTYTEGKRSGAAEVTTKVQEETIKKTDEARKDKVEADEKVRAKPIDAVIDGLR